MVLYHENPRPGMGEGGAPEGGTWRRSRPLSQDLAEAAAVDLAGISRWFYTMTNHISRWFYAVKILDLGCGYVLPTIVPALYHVTFFGLVYTVPTYNLYNCK